MAEYSINKGIGRNAEFKGLKSQYLFIFAGGLLGVFVLFVVMYMIGIDQMVCIIFGVISASVLVWGTFHLNEKYGEYGLLKLQALRNHPRFIINRKQIPSLFIRNIKRKAA
ncbi:MAG: DUF4133 domain-containing protein [Bacteroides sp.]|nr:DUF4133 domain-containing protein [Bacteroides sp.]